MYESGFADNSRVKAHATLAGARRDLMRSGKDGGWIYRVEPREENPRTYRLEAVKGAVHMNAQGDIGPMGIPNTASTAWLNRTARAVDRFLGPDPVGSRRVLAQTVAARLAMGQFENLHGAEGLGRFGLDPMITRGNHAIFDPLGMDKFPDWNRPGNKGPVSTIAFVLGGLRRSGWYINNRGGSRVVLRNAARGTMEGRNEALAQLGNRLSHTALRGIKAKEPNAAASLMERVARFADRAIDFRRTLDQWRGGPGMSNFPIWELRPTDQTHFVPQRWLNEAGLRGDAGLLRHAASDFIISMEHDFRRGEPGALTSRPADTWAGVNELLLRLDRMDEPTLRATVQEARVGNPTTPEAHLLQDFPGLQPRFLGSTTERAAVRKAHKAMFDALWDATGKKANKEGRPQAVGIEEKAMGTPNDPNTPVGRAMRKGPLALALLGTMDWAASPMPANFSPFGVPIAGMADSILGYTAYTAIKYGNALDARARFQKKYTQAQIDADPALKQREKEHQEAVESAKRYQNSASLISFLRSVGSAANYQAMGLPVMAGFKMVQAATTTAWILARWPTLPARMVSKTVNLASRGRINIDYNRWTPSFLKNMPEDARSKMMYAAAAGMIGVPLITAAMTYVPWLNSYYNSHVTPDKQYVDSVLSQLWNNTGGRLFEEP